jgi:hypothetical protein
MGTDKDYLISNKAYDLLKRFTTLIVPAIGALYFGLAGIWNLPAAEQVVGTCALIATFGGVLLKFSENSYNASEDKFDGVVVVKKKSSGTELYDMTLNGPAEDLKGQKAVTFKVVDDTAKAK